jgi:hypothetical protein
VAISNVDTKLLVDRTQDKIKFILQEIPTEYTTKNLYIN